MRIDPDNKGAPNPDTPNPEDAAADPMAALDQGITEATPESAPQQPAPPVAAEGEEPAGGAPPGTQNAEDKTKPDAGATPPAAAGEEDPAKAAAAEEAKIAEEVKALGLKEKGEARFREMIGEIKTLAPYKEAMEKAGIKDVAELPKIVERAKIGEDMVAMVQETGASPEQYGMALDYMSVVSKALKGDRASAEKALEMVLGEARELAASLGKELPGVFDPLDGFEDLAKSVKDGDMPREKAIEVANARRTQAALAQQQTTQAQEQQRVAQELAQVRAGIDSLAAWEADKLKDPKYMQLRPLLTKKVAEIRKKFAPSEWAEATQLAYEAISAAAAAPAQPQAPPMGPVRPSGPRPSMVPEFDNPMAALDFALKEGE